MNGKRYTRLLALTGLALLLFSPPLIGLFDRPSAGSLSWLPAYLFIAWGSVIGLAAWLLERTPEKPHQERPQHEE